MDKKSFPNSRIEKIADMPYYTEGPVVDERGNVYFTTLAGGSIMKWEPGKGALTEWATSDCPNGQVILPSGDHLVCDSRTSSLRRYDPAGRLIKEEISGACAGIEVQVPNDVVVDANGVIYFTDSVRHEGKVFLLHPQGGQRVIAACLDYPNGLVLSEDGRLLYVTESYRNRVLVIDLGSRQEGELNWQVLADLPGNASGKPEENLPDGMARDSAGNVWVAHYGMSALQVLSPDGRVLGSVQTGMPLTSNLLFINESQLIVTGGYGEPGPGALLRITI